MKGLDRAAWICVMAGIALVFAASGCVHTYSDSGRNPEPAVNIRGTNLKIALLMGEGVPDEAIFKVGLASIVVEEIHQTLQKGFDNAFGDYAVADKTDANVLLEITSLRVRLEEIAGHGTTLSLVYKAQLRLVVTGEIVRTAAGTSFPKNPWISDGDRVCEDVFETMFEDIVNQLFAGGNFILPEIPEGEPDREEPTA